MKARHNMIFAILAAALHALGRYGRAVAQPWRMSGKRVGFGNRR
jgi:hypothetical protein